MRGWDLVSSCLVAGSGLTALHLAAIKGSVAVVRALVRAGASLDALTLSGVLNPNLSRGSTALHIAAARGHAACVSALMESQASIPGNAIGCFHALLGDQNCHSLCGIQLLNKRCLQASFGTACFYFYVLLGGHCLHSPCRTYLLNMLCPQASTQHRMLLDLRLTVMSIGRSVAVE